MQFGLSVTVFGVPFAVEDPLASACGSVAVAVTACEDLHGFLRHWPFLKSKHKVALAGILAGFFFGPPPTKAFFVETCWRTKKDRESMPSPAVQVAGRDRGICSLAFPSRRKIPYHYFLVSAGRSTENGWLAISITVPEPFSRRKTTEYLTSLKLNDTSNCFSGS
jgi:hypothetical protein